MKVQVFPQSQLTNDDATFIPPGKGPTVDGQPVSTKVWMDLKHNDSSSKVIFSVICDTFIKGTTVDIQGSLNGTNWVTLVSGINSNRHVIVDICPYYRCYHNNLLIGFNSEAKISMGN